MNPLQQSIVHPVRFEVRKIILYLVGFGLICAGAHALYAAALPEAAGGLTAEVAYSERMRIAWIEIYRDIFQKLAFLIASVFILIQIEPFRRIVEDPGKRIRSTREIVLLTSVFFLFGTAMGLVGYWRAGESDWAFLDIQLIYAMLSGLIAGPWAGLVCGGLSYLTRIVVGVPSFRYAVILLGAGAIGGGFSKLAKQQADFKAYALVGGILGALLHGALTYQPLWATLGFSTMLTIIFSLVVVESASLYAFVALSVGIMHDRRRKELEQLLPQMKLRFLQAQINPHFLFNTLNTIAAVCIRERAEQARDLVIKLSNFFRRIVKREDEWVTLEDELSHIDSYLGIEKARYQDRLSIVKDIRLSSKGLRVHLPILIIQPLVENAIRHGIAPMGEGGVLTISASENDKYVDIQIKDNGVGIPPDKLKTIQAHGSTKNAAGEAGIGLRNISQRLRYQFGSQSDLVIKSGTGQGTVVQFKIPLASAKKES